MKYTRKDLVGQTEIFDGEPSEIMLFIKLLEKNDNNEIDIGVDIAGTMSLNLDNLVFYEEEFNDEE